MGVKLWFYTMLALISIDLALIICFLTKKESNIFYSIFILLVGGMSQEAMRRFEKQRDKVFNRIDYLLEGKDLRSRE